MTRTIYRTATSLDGYIADRDHSLGWLFDVDASGVDDHEEFLSGVGVIVEGSSTYEWILRETDMLAKPDQWQQYYGLRPTFVFTSRQLPTPVGADVRFRNGPVGAHLAEIALAVGQQKVWIVGGGDLAAQFLDIGTLDEILLTLAPVTLGAGSPLFPRRIESDRLHLTSAVRRGQFVDLSYVLTTPRTQRESPAEWCKSGS